MTHMESRASTAFNASILKNPILGKLLPLEIKRTYPRLFLKNGTLCAAFVGFRMLVQNGRASAMPPAYYLCISYPSCELLSFERLSPVVSAEDSREMTPCPRENILKLDSLYNEALETFNGHGEGLAEVLDSYNGLLDGLLEKEQLEVLNRFCAVSD